MEKDIVPELLELLQSEYKELIEDSDKLSKLLKRVADEKATLLDAQKYAEEVGRILQQMFFDNVSESILPDGKMYYNIAKRLLEPILKDSYEDVSNYCYDAQKQVNIANKIGLNPVEAQYNRDRVDGIIDYVSNADSYSQVQKSFEDSLMNYSQSVYDDFIKSNAEFKYYSGMKPKIIRVADSGACKWCRNLQGSYEYPDVPQDVYRRHENCYCTVTYQDEKGKYQDVHSKKIIVNKEDIEDRINYSKISLNNGFLDSVSKREMTSGARITNPDSKEGIAFAEKYYGLVRSRKDDVLKISENVGMPIDKIQKIKDYIFVNKSLYDEDLQVWKRFDEDCAIAHSWQRLIEGRNIKPHDYTLINHELLEMEIKKSNPSISYNEAHTIASKTYNYGKEADDYYDYLKKLDSKK